MASLGYTSKERTDFVAWAYNVLSYHVGPVSFFASGALFVLLLLSRRPEHVLSTGTRLRRETTFEAGIGRQVGLVPLAFCQAVFPLCYLADPCVIKWLPFFWTPAVQFFCTVLFSAGGRWFAVAIALFEVAERRHKAIETDLQRARTARFAVYAAWLAAVLTALLTMVKAAVVIGSSWRALNECKHNVARGNETSRYYCR